MLVMTSQGLYCPAGNFHIDPKRAVENAVITHAHSDHARRGARKYFCATSGVELLRARLGKKIDVETMNFGEKKYFGDVAVSLHPAGHILGSSQVRMEFAGEVWVASGDYKREFDPTCEPFENVECDVFVTEATFGTPGYTWPKHGDRGREIWEWWQENAGEGLNSVLFAYSLGKAQRVLGELEPFTEEEIICHPATFELTECYRAGGIKLAPTKCLSTVENHERPTGKLFLIPQSTFKTEQAKILGNYKTAFASGWMAKNTRWHSGYDKGFVMSDHADWDDLVRTIFETRAKRIYVQHRGTGALVKYLRQQGLSAFPEEDLLPKNPDQLSFL